MIDNRDDTAEPFPLNAGDRIAALQRKNDELAAEVLRLRQAATARTTWHEQANTSPAAPIDAAAE